MAHIRRHPNARHRWQVRYVDPNGKERSKNFARKVDAERFLHTVEVQKIKSEWTDPAAGKTKFGEWAIQVDATFDHGAVKLVAYEVTPSLPRHGQPSAGPRPPRGRPGPPGVIHHQPHNDQNQYQ